MLKIKEDQNNFGTVFSLGYLGSAILANGKTGLGCLQEPLRELYSLYRQFGFRLLQDRRLIISLEGITMLYNELGIEKYSHNELASVNDAQLLKFFCEKKRDKKYYCAFLPIGEERDPKYNNLFCLLDKQYSDVFESLNPAIITLIMRRSTGIQALEAHVFISRSINEAKNIVNRIHEVCDIYKSNLNTKAKLFQYKPYKNDILKHNEKVLINNDYNLIRNNKKEDEINRRPTSVTNSSQQSLSVFSKIKGNFKDKNKYFKKQKKDNRKNTERDISQISIKSVPDHKIYQSELSLMMNKTPLSSNNDNILLKSSTSIASNNFSTKSEFYNDKKENKISFPRRLLLSARSSIKSSRSSNGSQLSFKSKNSDKSVKSKSISSLADIDFRDPKTIFDSNLLIDGSYPSIASRSISPVSNSRISTHIKSFKYKNPSLVKSDKHENFKKTNNSNSYLSSKSQSKISKTQLSIENELSNDEIKTIEKYPELLSNHLVWNPIKKAPESVGIIITNSNTKFQQLYSPIHNENFSKNDLQTSNKKNTWMENTTSTKSKIIKTSPASEIYETYSINKFGDSAYNTNSSTEEHEFEVRIADVASSENRTPFLQTQINERNNYKKNNETKLSKTNNKQIIGGIKVFPTLQEKKPNHGQNEIFMVPNNSKIGNKIDKTFDNSFNNNSNLQYYHKNQIKNLNINENKNNDINYDYFENENKYTDVNTKTSKNNNYIYYFNNQHFGGY